MSCYMISSVNNDKIKHVTRLVKSSALRREEGLFVVEGERICKEIPIERFVEGFVSEDYLARGGYEASDGYILNGCEYTVVSNQVYKKISDTISGQGILGIVRQDLVNPDNYLEDMKGSVRLLLLENIQDPGNLGTMIRTAEAAGIDAIITDRSTVDVYNPKVIRSTMGGIFRMKVIYSDDFEAFLKKARSRGIRLFGAILDGSTDYRKCDYKGSIGILIGNEGNGLSASVREMVDVKISIPMEGKVESLNAAVAAALIMYEAIR